MPSLKDLKNRIGSVKSTQKITSAMKMVAAAKLRKAQEQALASRPYTSLMDKVVTKIASKTSGNTIDLLTGKADNKTHLIVVFSADRGLCGGFNGSITRAVRAEIKKLEEDGRIEKLEFLQDHWRLIDEHGKEHLAKQVILTLPQEQTNVLVKDLDIGFQITENKMKPCFTVMLGLKESPIFRHSGYVLHNSIVSWCANETSKERAPNSNDLTLLTLQTTEEYGFANFEKYKENKDQILNEIVSEFLDIFKIDDSEVVHKQVHGWLYAYSDPVNSEVFVNKVKGIGITGDWFTGGRAENSWKNAKLLAEKLSH